MNSIIFIAPPAAGKGTQSKKLMMKYHLPHISTGDLLRDATKKDDERGRYIKEQMALGHLVSDEIINELMMERLNQSDCADGYILDGFPRSLEQAYAYNEILEKLNKPLGHVIYLSIDEETAKKRILGRISCPKCGAVYNDMIDVLKPKEEGICDHCGNALEKRVDDNEETFCNRFETYMKNTEPLLDYYRKLNAVYTINSMEYADTIFEEIETIFRSQA